MHTTWHKAHSTTFHPEAVPATAKTVLASKTQACGRQGPPILTLWQWVKSGALRGRGDNQSRLQIRKGFLEEATCMHACSVMSNSATPQTVARQAPLSMGFPRQESWSGLPFPSPGALPDPGMALRFPELAGGFFTTELPGKPFLKPSSIKSYHLNTKLLTKKMSSLNVSIQ